jgi:L-arabinokinase
MYQVVQGVVNNQSDTADFIETLNNLGEHSVPEARRLFDKEAELVVARAPGRLDVMGGIADYSGSLVLELPIREATFVALQRDPIRRIRVVSLTDDHVQKLAIEISLADLESAGNPLNYESARAYFRRDAARHWAAYVAGAFLVLMRERHLGFQEGARILIVSRVPAGKGVSSSAALEVATMQAVCAAFGIEIEPRELAIFCQRVENLVVGAPCGIMDQMTSVCGEANRLVALLCQPAELIEMIDVPDDIGFWGIDSGVRHSVAGADYGSVRTGAFMGYRIIAELSGLACKENATGELCQIDDPRWGGYLANIATSEFEQSFAARLPEQINGAEFLSLYKGTTDPVTRIEPTRNYAVRVATAHPIYEHERVRTYAQLLAGTASEQRLELLGELMYQSHESYSACGLHSEGTDLLVQLVREAGAGEGLYGAKITGGGCGGTVAVVGHRTAGPAIARLAEKYESQTGHRPYIFAGSSDGSAAFGCLKLKNK